MGLLAVAALLLATHGASAGAAAQAVPSLDIVPADAAFYSAMLRNREQLDAIVNSKAFAKIRALPYVQMGLGMLQPRPLNPESPIGRFEAVRNDPEVKRSLTFLGDLFSDEIFIYGGPSFKQAVELCKASMGTFISAASWRSHRAAGTRGGKPSTEEIQGRVFVRALVKQVDLIKFPELVIGGKVKDKALAKEQLDHLEANLQKAVAQAPLLQGRLKRATVNGHSYLTLSLDGSMIPWEPKVAEKIRSLAGNSRRRR